MGTIESSELTFPVSYERYSGKVRDVYIINHTLAALVATDRISAFDHILPNAIPHKGQVLTQVAEHFLRATADIVPNYMINSPDPNILLGRYCKPYPIEMVIRGYLAGHAWRIYKEGGREICGVQLPEGLKQNDKLPEPIITPTTKAAMGHDEDISEELIIRSKLVDAQEYATLKNFTQALYEKGTEMAAEQGLILVDTKYEFGTFDGEIYLIDEVHTPDSSRYFYSEGFDERQEKGEPQKQLSKEFVREWLMEKGFSGLDGQEVPEMPVSFVKTVSERYIQLYELITGKTFIKSETEQLNERMQNNLTQALIDLGMEA